MATVGELSMQILNDLLRPMTHEAVVKALQVEKIVRLKYGSSFVAEAPPVLDAATRNSKGFQGMEIKNRVHYSKEPQKDIYGQEKPQQVRYFECSNCHRKVAGSRFATHIERCLSGRNARAKAQYQKRQAEMDDVAGGSPSKRRKLDTPVTKMREREVFSRSPTSSSRQSSPRMD